ncbi:MAG: metal-dependent hydrolase [Terriglobia bacterium]
MFIGHFGVALAAKKVAPRTSLGTLVMAAQFVDLLWPVFLLLGVERVIIAPGDTAVTPLDFISYPITHSLLGGLGWACLFAGIYKIVKRDSRGAVCLWFVVISHWVLDALSHRPDLPLYPGSSTYVGLGLWNSRFGTIVIESAIFALGAMIYAKATRPRDRVGFVAFRSFIALLFLLYLVNIFGPPPPSEKAVALAALGMWLFVLWAYWLDRHRAVNSAPPPIAAEALGSVSGQPPEP